MKSVFSYSHYKDLLEKAKLTVDIVPFCQFNEKPALILRHDIDVDIHAAHKMALIEESVGVYSTFFFLTNCPTYNIMSEKGRFLLRDLSQRGFEVGLHFDPTVYEKQDLDSLSKKVAFECAIISEVTQKDVTSISLHNPSIHNTYPLFDGFINAYAPEFFNQEKYLSDSRMIFRRDPLEFCQEAQREVRQLLIHPIHYTESGKVYPHPIAEFASRFVSELDSHFMVNSEYARLSEEPLESYLCQKYPN